MSNTVKGPWFGTMVCSNYEECGFYENPPGMKQKSFPPFRICPECGAENKYKTGRFVCEEKENRKFFGLLKSKEIVIVGFELLNTNF